MKLQVLSRGCRQSMIIIIIRMWRLSPHVAPDSDSIRPYRIPPPPIFFLGQGCTVRCKPSPTFFIQHEYLNEKTLRNLSRWLQSTNPCPSRTANPAKSLMDLAMASRRTSREFLCSRREVSRFGMSPTNPTNSLQAHRLTHEGIAIC